jgi:flagella basal body P-ring formation protein FlgA
MRSSSRLAAALALAAATAAAAPRGRIAVRPDATVVGDTIHLGDIATVEGGDRDALAALPLGPAPGAGESRTLDGASVLEALRRQAGGLDGLAYTIPPSVRVRRATQDVPASAVRAAVEAFVAETLGAAASDAVLHALEVPGPLRLPVGPYRVRVLSPPGVPLLGRVRLQVELLVEDRPVKTVWVTADVGLTGLVVVARRPIARGEKLAADDLALEQRDLSRVARGVVTELAEAVGTVAQAPIVPYTPIKREQLAPAAVVHRGDAVLLVAERGRLRITAAGEVREDAGAGQQVRVTNRASRKDLIGRVVDGSTVAVEF